MNPEDAVELGREAIKACMFIGGPIIVLGLIVGLAVGLLQAMTQVQDQTVSFVPKILVMILGIGVGLPWLSDKMVDYTKSALETPMIHMNRRTEAFNEPPAWERPIEFQPDQELNHNDDAGQDNRLASPRPATNVSSMPRLSQNHSMPTMKPSTTSSMPRLHSPGESFNEPPTPRIAEILEPDF